MVLTYKLGCAMLSFVTQKNNNRVLKMLKIGDMVLLKTNEFNNTAYLKKYFDKNAIVIAKTQSRNVSQILFVNDNYKAWVADFDLAKVS